VVPVGRQLSQRREQGGHGGTYQLPIGAQDFGEGASLLAKPVHDFVDPIQTDREGSHAQDPESLMASARGMEWRVRGSQQHPGTKETAMSRHGEARQKERCLPLRGCHHGEAGRQ
jgi:hypothetical protein